MRSVADALRTQTAEAVRRLSIEERIALALSLGDADLDLYARANGLDRAAALERLRAQRAQGRPVRSRSADPAR